VNPPAPVRIRQITPNGIRGQVRNSADWNLAPVPDLQRFATSVNEFFVNAIAAGEARESSLARLPEISAWRVPRRGNDEC
jgi:hypothetical protein